MDKEFSDETIPQAHLPSIPLQTGVLKKCKAFFNGYQITIKDPEDIKLIQSRGAFGKGTITRSKVEFENMEILPKRQLAYRTELVKKQCQSHHKPNAVILLSDTSEEERGDDEITSKTNDDRDTDEDIEDDSDTDEDINTDDDSDDYFINLKLEYGTNKLKVAQLHLSYEEAFFLMQLNCLEIIDASHTSLMSHVIWRKFRELNNFFVENYVVYYYYKSKNWIVKSGLKFGADYLLYKGNPENCHSTYVVIIDNMKNTDKPRRSMTMTSLLGLNRLAESAGKELLLTHVIYPESEQLNLDNDNCIKSFKIEEVVFRRWINKLEDEATNSSSETIYLLRLLL